MASIRAKFKLSQPETVSRFETVRKCSEALELGLRGRQLPSSHGIREPASLVGTVTERLVCGMPTATKPDGGPASQSKRPSFGIKNLKFAFYANGTVVIDRNPRGCHFFS